MQTRLNSTICLFLNGSITAEHYFWSNDSGLIINLSVSWIHNILHVPLLIDLILMSKTTFFSIMSGRVVLGWTSTKQGLMWLAQGHNTVTPVMLELPTAWIGLGSNTLILSHCAPILNYVFLLLGTASRWPNEKHRSPLFVQADQSLRTLTAMVHAGMSDFYYFGMASRTDHHSPANCSLTQFLIFGCLISKNSQTHFFHPFHSGDKCFYELKLSHKFW